MTGKKEVKKGVTVTYWVFVLVGVNARVDDALEEILENVGEALGAEHTVECADEHRLVRVQTR